MFPSHPDRYTVRACVLSCRGYRLQKRRSDAYKQCIVFINFPVSDNGSTAIAYVRDNTLDKTNISTFQKRPDIDAYIPLALLPCDEFRNCREVGEVAIAYKRNIVLGIKPAKEAGKKREKRQREKILYKKQ